MTDKLSKIIQRIQSRISATSIRSVSLVELGFMQKQAVILEQRAETHVRSWFEDWGTVLIELYCDFRDRFDGSEYQHGKKDGLRIALVLLGLNVPPREE